VTALEELCTTMRRALRNALADLEPAELVQRALPPRPPRNGRVCLIAAGKASIAMTRGAFARWGDAIEDALVVTVDADTTAFEMDGTPPIPRAVTVRRAPHPVPDDRSVAAAEDARQRAGRLGARDLLLALISGGASSVLAAPLPGAALAAKVSIVERLLRSGASIKEVNVVRRHVSSIKGGRLALAAHPARVLTYLVADVVGAEPHDVGAGPTVPDPTTIEDAREVLLRRLGVSDVELAESVQAGAGERPGLRLRHRILAGPDDLARTLAEHLARAGLRARVLPAEEGDAATVIRRRVTLARSLSPGEAAVVACEPTLALPARCGRGGRAGYVALAAMRDLPADVALLCAASDGVDGSSGSAGALVTGAHATRVAREEVEAGLDEYDDARVHALLGTALPGGPTGTNLTDVHAVARSSGG